MYSDMVCKLYNIKKISLDMIFVALLLLPFIAVNDPPSLI